MTDKALQDPKQRSLDALQRRMALAQNEYLLQQQKDKKRPRQETKGVKPEVDASSTKTSDAVAQPSSNVLSKKGNISFSGHTTSQDVDASDSTYFQLSHPVDENLLPATLKISDRRGSTVNHILHELLQSGDSAQKYMQGSRSMKVDNWILLDNVVQSRGTPFGSRIRALNKHSKRSKKHMSMKQQKKCGILDLPQELQRMRRFYDTVTRTSDADNTLKISSANDCFDIFKPMHEMWKGYIMQLIKNVGKNQLAQCLLTADLHGAVILVVHCKIASFVGVNGIMIRETAETFGIITEDNKFRGSNNFGLSITMALHKAIPYTIRQKLTPSVIVFLYHVMMRFYSHSTYCGDPQSCGAQKAVGFYVASRRLLEDYTARGQARLEEYHVVKQAGDNLAVSKVMIQSDSGAPTWTSAQAQFGPVNTEIQPEKPSEELFDPSLMMPVPLAVEYPPLLLTNSQLPDFHEFANKDLSVFEGILEERENVAASSSAAEIDGPEINPPVSAGFMDGTFLIGSIPILSNPQDPASIQMEDVVVPSISPWLFFLLF